MKVKEIQDAGATAICRLAGLRRPGLGHAQERLWRHGAKALGNVDLLALVLGAGGPVPAVEMAAQLLSQRGFLAQLATMRPESLCRDYGMGLARSARLLAAVEMGHRCRQPLRRLGLPVRKPQDLGPLLEEEFRGCDREHFVALYLDTRHRLAAMQTVSIGSLNASLVHPREVFRPAVAIGAAAIIAAHNHPSGCVRPSAEDLQLTSRLAGCGRLLGIDLLDHVIYGAGTIVSLREHGWPETADAGLATFPGTEG